MTDLQPVLAIRPPLATPLSLRANFKWTFAGNLVHALGQWGVLTLIAKFTSPAAVGMFGLGLFISAPVMAVAMLQLRSVQVTDAKGEYPFCDYFGTRLLWTAAGLAFIVIWAIGAHYDRDTVWVVVLVALAKAFDSLSDIVRGVFQRCERMDYSAVSLMIKGVGAAVAVGLVISARSVIAASAAMAVVYLISFFAYDLLWARSLLGGLADQTPEHRRMRPRFRWASIVRLSWTALPLGIVMGLITLQINIPRYVLEGYFGLAALGFFTAMVYPIQAGQMVIGALGQSAAPRLARYFAEDLAAYRVLLRKLLLVAGGLAALMVLTTALGGRPILRIFFDPAYAEYHLEFVVLAIAAAVQLISSCWGYALTSARRFRVQVTVTTISCLVTALAALLLVPRYGVLGASISVLVTSIVLWIVLLVVMRSTLRRRGTMDTSLATPGGDNEVEGS